MAVWMRLLLVVALGMLPVACQPTSTSADVADDTDTVGAHLFESFKPVPYIIIPSGTRLRVALRDPLSTAANAPGDRFTASLAEPVLLAGKPVLERGTKVIGRVVDVNDPGDVEGRASLNLILEAIQKDGTTISIDTRPFVVEAESRVRESQQPVVPTAAAPQKAEVEAPNGPDRDNTSTDIQYPPDTRLNFVLASALEM